MTLRLKFLLENINNNTHIIPIFNLDINYHHNTIHHVHPQFLVVGVIQMNQNILLYHLYLIIMECNVYLSLLNLLNLSSMSLDVLE